MVKYYFAYRYRYKKNTDHQKRRGYIKYLFAKNDPAEIRKAADQISDFCSKIEKKHSVDTAPVEVTLFTIVGTICTAIGVANLTTGISQTRCNAPYFQRQRYDRFLLD